MADTFKKISSVTLTGTQSEVDFTSIPSTYKDLLFIISTRASSGSPELYARINNSSSGYANAFLNTGGSSVSGGTYHTSQFYIGEPNYAANSANSFSSAQIYIPNYASSQNKITSVDNTQETNSSTSWMHLVAATWTNSSAITSFKFYMSASTFTAGSTFTLYGISNS